MMDLMIKNQDAMVVLLKMLRNGKCLVLSVRELAKTIGGKKHDNPRSVGECQAPA